MHTTAQGVDGFGADRSTDIGKESGFRRRDEINMYAEEDARQFGMDRRKRAIIVMALLLIVCFPLALVLPHGLFDSGYRITPGAVSASLSRNVHDLVAMFTDPGSAGMVKVTVARFACIVLAGAGLGVTGAVYQGALKNALASPTTLGVESGAMFGGFLYIVSVVIGGNSFLTLYTYSSFSDINQAVAGMDMLTHLWFLFGRPLCMLAGSFVSVGFVLLVAKIAGRGKTSSIWLIVTGTILTTAFGTAISVGNLYYDAAGNEYAVDALGAIGTEAFTLVKDFLDVAIVAVPVVACCAILFAQRSKLGLLSFGDDEARSMGVNPNRLRNTMVALTTFMTAIITAFCGSIGFLGFMVPHITRRFIGADFRYLLPASALTGSLVLLISYYIIYLFSSQAANYVGVFTSMVGFVVFVYLFVKRGRTDSDAWN